MEQPPLLATGPPGTTTGPQPSEPTPAAVPEPDPQPDLPGVVEFYPEGLLHKFGFADGDMLYELTEAHGLRVDHQDLLVAVVERLVVPRLDQAVETYTLGTMHNPIRAATIDGERADIDSTLTPDVVKVLVADIIRVARTLQQLDAAGESLASPGLPDPDRAGRTMPGPARIAAERRGGARGRGGRR